MAACGGSGKTGSAPNSAPAETQSASVSATTGPASESGRAAGIAAGQALLRNFNRTPRPTAFALALDFQCFVAAHCSAHLVGQPATPLSAAGRQAAASVVLRDTALMNRMLRLHGVPSNVHDVPGLIAFLRNHGVR